MNPPLKSYEGKDLSILPGRANEKNPTARTVEPLRISISLKESEKNKSNEQEMAVFHNWLVYLTVLSFPEINKDYLEPVSDIVLYLSLSLVFVVHIL